MTFKLEKDWGDYKIYTGKNNDKHYLYTDGLAFVMFKTEKEAQNYCNKLNDVTNNSNHVWNLKQYRNS